MDAGELLVTGGIGVAGLAFASYQYWQARQEKRRHLLAAMRDVFREHHSAERMEQRRGVKGLSLWFAELGKVHAAEAGFDAGKHSLQALASANGDQLPEKKLLAVAEGNFNYLEMLGMLYREEFMGDELLELIHNSTTRFWSAITQTNEDQWSHNATPASSLDEARKAGQLRFNLAHVRRCYDRIRPAPTRGFDWGGDAYRLAKAVWEFRHRPGFRQSRVNTGGIEGDALPKSNENGPNLAKGIVATPNANGTRPA
ncbi:MAG: hypothetical protein IT462_11470 [Planctomycetes bacterium]|nr:hypothetical protein [Planctomycetota bacterium]